MIFGTAATTVLAAALFLTLPGRAVADSDTNTAPAPGPYTAPVPGPAPGAANVTLTSYPSGVTEVLKMYKGGIPADIMISYINTSPLTFYLSADNIISLQQQGVPMPVINAMINRYGQLQRQSSMLAGAAQPQQQYAAPQAQAQVPAQAPPPQYYSYAPADQAVTYPVAAPSYPVYEPYTYYDPYYYDPFYYPGYYGWPVGISFGYFGGFGHGGYGHGGYGRGGFGHVGGFGGGGHVGVGGGGHVGVGGGGHVGGGGIGGGGHAGAGGGGGHR
jgi:hypothetical protein